MSLNEDFSFVRFLKVVKTLYESSTFTQLGRTVGSALNPLSIPSQMNDDESRKSNRSQKPRETNMGEGHESFFDALADACSGKSKLTSDPALCKGDEGNTIANARNENIFVQMLNGCSLLTSHPDNDEYFSDEDTFKTRTDEDASYVSDGDSLDDTLATEDDYARRRSSRRRSSGRSKRRR